jgi:MFS family permease
MATFFYGWIMVAIALASTTMVYGIRHSFSVFFPSILAEFGWTRGDTATILSLNVLVYGLVAPVAGTLCDRWKPTRVIPIGALTLALATAGCSYARELWHFYLLFGFLMPLGTAFCGWPVLGPTLANWFATRRGLAMSLGQAGVSLSFLIAMLARSLIGWLGWRSSYLILAGLVAGLLWPLRWLFRYRPEDKGLHAYGAEGVPKGVGLAKPTESCRTMIYTGWTLRQATRTYRLWCLVASNFFFWGVGNYLVLTHSVKFIEEIGYSSMFAASVFSFLGISMLAGHLSAPISDYIGRKPTVVLACGLAIGALSSLLIVSETSQPWLLYLFTWSLGYGTGLYSPTLFASAADLFHGEHFGTIAGLLLVGLGVGGAIGPWLGGHMYDVSASYRGAFVLSLACYGLAGVSFLVGVRTRPTGELPRVHPTG